MINGDTPNPGNPPADPLIGRTLNGRFSIIEPLGVGGMGKVYRALQAPLDRVVALKVLNPTFQSSRDPGFQKRFLREASLTSKLRHPNTVTVIDYGQTDDGIYYIAMEYLEGRTLLQALGQQGPLPWSRAISIAQQVCRSLREAHSMGIVHRDLKPANIILLNEADQDLVKVLDFGLVKSVAAPAPEAAPSPEITQNGTFLGSPQYMAPEQARNTADARSDVYSLGIVLYQMLMGRPPFVSRDHIELIFSHYKETPPTFAQLRPDIAVPPELEAVVRRCLEKDPARRYQTMDELLDGLREANAQAGGHSGVFKRPGTANTTGPYPSPLFTSVAAPEPAAEHTLAVDISVEVPAAMKRARTRLLGLGLLGGVAVCGIAAGAFFLLRKPAEPPSTETLASAPAAAPRPAEPAEPAPEPPPPPGTQMVRFRLMSQPTGARVFYKGKERGITPFVLEIPQGADGSVTAELTFALEGHQTETVITGGSGEVVLSQKLQKRRVGAGGRVEMASAGTAEFAPADSVMPVSMPVRMGAEPAPAANADKGATPAPGAIGAMAAAPAMGSLGVPTLPTTTRPAGNGPLPFMETMGRPEQLEGKDIVYTREAIAAKVQGRMLVKCTITEQGRVENCRVLKSLPHMEQAVVESLRSRVYKPLQHEGRAVAVDYIFNIRLVLPRR